MSDDSAMTVADLLDMLAGVNPALPVYIVWKRKHTAAPAAGDVRVEGYCVAIYVE